MSNEAEKPIILLAFANDRDDRVRYLRHLSDEARRLRQALQGAEDAGLCRVVVRQNATLDDILDVFQDPECRNRVAIFHYGGHADSYHLLFEAPDGRPASTNAAALAAMLAQQSGLQLVFLNGCSTQPQAQGLLDAGVSAVIATAQAIDDGAATAFAERFYQGLARGTSLGTAFREAEAAGTSHVDSPRNLYVGGRAADAAADRWPWEWVVRSGAEAVEGWNLPDAAGDPLFGLPPLPEMDLPESPYRYLNWYRREDAHVFFGRGREIRDLFERVTALRAAPMVLFYGQAGVGKSSLLAAGLQPRLEASHVLRYVRRDQALGLLGTLRKALGLGNDALGHAGATASPVRRDASEVATTSGRATKVATTSQDAGKVTTTSGGATKVATTSQNAGKVATTNWGEEIGAAWRGIEEREGKPLLVILDQVEEVYTRPNPALPEEMAAFLAALEFLSDVGQRPRGRLLLGFRKEWLAEVEAQLKAHNLPCGKFFLERLERRGIIEVVTGPSRAKRLRDQYRLRVEDGLPELIADDLLADPGSAVAPTLQILLAKMWQRATAVDYDRPTFDGALYDELRDQGLGLGDFLDGQLVALHSGQPEVVDSGLALDLLAHHTTPLGTAEQRTFGDLEEAYGHRRDTLPGLLQGCQDLYLLVDPARNQPGQRRASRLAHDTLAPLVRQRFDESDRPGQRARRILESRAVDWEVTEEGAPLDGVDLAAVEQGMGGMRACKPPEERLVEASRVARSRRQRNRRIWQGMGLLAVLLILIAASLAAWQWRTAEGRRVEAEDARATAQAESTRALHAESTAVAEAENARQAQATAEAQRDRAQRTMAGQLAALSEIAADSDLPQRALLLAVEATDAYSPTLLVAYGALHDTLGSTGGMVLSGHEDGVNAVAFSPDGRWLATASHDSSARLWDVQDPTATPAVLRGHEDGVTAVAFSPDGRWLATASRDNAARLWDVQDPTGAPAVLRGHEGVVTAVAFSPDGRWLATSSYDGSARLWDVQYPTAAPAVLRGHEGAVNAVAFSPDGRWLATSSYDGTAELWDIQDSTAAPAVLGGHEGGVYAVAFSPDGCWLATAGRDSTARLWDVQDPTAEPAVLGGHEGAVNAIAFSADGRWLATGSWDRTTRLWDMQDATAAPAVLRGHEGGVTTVAFSPDGRWLATASGDNTARLWDVQYPTAEPAVLRGHEGPVYGVAFSADGRWLATASYDGTARLWDVQYPTAEPAVLRGHEDVVWAVAFSADGRWLATAGWDNTVRLWDMHDSAADPAVLRGHEGWVRAVAFSADGRWLASASDDDTARLWDVENPAAEPAVLRGHEGVVTTVAFSPDGRWLATSSYDGSARLWDVQYPTAAPAVLRGHEGPVYDVAFSPDGRCLATAGRDNSARLWDVQDPAAALTVLHGHEGLVNAVAFSADGRWLATGSDDSTVRLWDVQDLAAEPAVLRGHRAGVTAVAFSADGRWLATASDDGTAGVWDVQDPAAEQVVLRGHEDLVDAVAFSADGRWLATGSWDGTARVWAASVDLLVAKACTVAGRNFTLGEWQRYFPGEPYRPTCSNLPAHPSALGAVAAETP